MQEASSYGQHYWCVKIPQSLSDGTAIDATLTDATEIYLYADRCEILPSGALEFRRVAEDETTGGEVSFINFAMAAGEWILVYAANASDRSALAVES